MPITSFLSRWKTDPSIAPNITTWTTIPERIPEFVPLPKQLHHDLVKFLDSKGIKSLYLHQSQAWNHLKDGHNLGLVTGTSSGKTLSYILPIAQECLKDASKRALFLYPTKSLAHDQLDLLKAIPGISSAAYDGDTPQAHRKSIRSNAQIVVSNPDMLHLGILPYHTSWEEFFQNLAYIVIDEMHVYRGVFGSHVANVLRRLKRISAFYGSDPQFFLTSATIGNPKQLAETLIDSAVSLITGDYSSRGEKHFLIYNPPVINPKFGLRANMHQESVRLTTDLVDAGYQTLLFGRSRRSIEYMLTLLRQKTTQPPESIRSYRSGYLPKQRREIETGLRSGRIKAVSATTALELGVDIGGLDSTILAGYPGTISGTWQQAGRSGRTDRPSLSVLVTSSNPLDQYIALHPEYIFSTNPESALIDPNNLLIVIKHLQCAVFELPFQDGEAYGNFTETQTREILEILISQNLLHSSQGKYFWMSDQYPASLITLRSTSNSQITLLSINTSGKSDLLGIIDYDSALWMVHPGAIYLHEGDSYHVDKLDLIENKSYLRPVDPDYYTESERNISFTIEQIQETGEISGNIKSLGEINVTSQVVGFKRINWAHYEVLGSEPLDLPQTNLFTKGFWVVLSQALESELLLSGLWSSSPNDYGSDWSKQREEVLRRDNNICQICGKKGDQVSLHVHHKQPLRSFTSQEEANLLDNLISLCPRCHHRAESIVKVNSGLLGLGKLLNGLAPLLLMCDPGDLGLMVDFKSPLGEGRPTVLIYENIPGGIGYSKAIFDHTLTLLKQASDLVSSCPCSDGCPSCVGPGGEFGSGGKKQTKAILDLLLH
jgi:DEAD/DEAH box helicase domain-containing protein